MLNGTQTATWVEHIASVDADYYECHILHNVCWQSRWAMDPAKEGDKPKNQIVVRILESELGGGLPKIGDRIVRGELHACQSGEDLQGLEHFCITAVKDLRRGTSLRHVMVQSAVNHTWGR